jgi:hypothetical protein
VLRIRDPVPFLPREPAWVKNQDPDHISESLELIFWIKILKFFDADQGIFLIRDPGWKNSDPG